MAFYFKGTPHGQRRASGLRLFHRHDSSRPRSSPRQILSPEETEPWTPRKTSQPPVASTLAECGLCNGTRSVLCCSARQLFSGGSAVSMRQRFGQDRIEAISGYSPPSESIRKPSRAAANNNKSAERKLQVNLEGTAVVYPEEVDALAAADGSFRTELSLNEMASALRIDPKSIANPRSKHEIDPEAVLFKAVTGRLTDQAKARSRWMREIELRGGPAASTAGCEWVTVEFPFSLNALKHPNRDQKVVLDAISHSARSRATTGGENQRRSTPVGPRGRPA